MDIPEYCRINSPTNEVNKVETTIYSPGVNATCHVTSLVVIVEGLLL
jgi:hypothetical protein